MGQIDILPDQVADQIAAGEVVERPASIVKELVENALDAGATEILVELEKGGKALIRVSDNGSGMSREDALLSIERHATSKIRTADDLVGVGSYGFRGEALPSIASVSRFELETSVGGPDATRVTVNGGRVDAVDGAVRKRGTTVSVRRVFFNTPARRKFLRSTAAETRACVEAVTALALARLDVSFRLLSDERPLLEAPACRDKADRIARLFGGDVAEGLLPVDHGAQGVTVRGHIQRPAEAGAGGRKAYLFINGRPFRDGFLVRAAEAGYRGAIAPGHRPTLFLELEVPGSGVDVNVHPAKLEVRFRDRFLIERTVEEAVRDALAPLGASASVGRGAGAAPWPGSGYTGVRGEQVYPAPPGEQVPQEELGLELPPSPEGPGPERLIQVFDSFILMEADAGISFIDQHSAHERILYEQAMRQLRSPEAGSQQLLLPITVRLTADQLDAVEEHGDMLRTIGFEVEPFGGRSVLIHATPNPHRRFDARRCFEELVADLAGDRLATVMNPMERFAATYGCKAAIKAGEPLEQSEMVDLVRRLFTCELPPHDVHGRPTIVRLSRRELERRFGR